MTDLGTSTLVDHASAELGRTELGEPRQPQPTPPKRARRLIRLVIAEATLLLTVALGVGWLWHQSEMASLRAEQDAQYLDMEALRTDLDTLYEYLDGIALRQQSVETIVRQSPDFAAVGELLENAAVRVHTKYSQGSGFRLEVAPGCLGTGAECDVYESEGYDSVIVTNYHVVSDVVDRDYEDRVVMVVGSDGSEAEGRVWDWDRKADLAVIDFDRSDLDRHLTPLLWAPSGSATIGDPVAIGGYPFDLQFVVTTGVLTGQRGTTWETDAFISAGNSGSPVVDAFGRVVGVASASGSGITDVVDIEVLCDRLLEC